MLTRLARYGTIRYGTIRYGTIRYVRRRLSGSTYITDDMHSNEQNQV